MLTHTTVVGQPGPGTWLHIHTGSVPCPETVLLRATGATELDPLPGCAGGDGEGEIDGDGLGELLGVADGDADLAGVLCGAFPRCPPALQAISTPATTAHPAPTTAVRRAPSVSTEPTPGSDPAPAAGTEA